MYAVPFQVPLLSNKLHLHYFIFKNNDARFFVVIFWVFLFVCFLDSDGI